METMVEKSKLYGRSREKRMGGKQKLKKKKKKFQWTEEMVEYLLNSLKRYKVMCDFLERTLMLRKLFNTVNC